MDPAQMEQKRADHLKKMQADLNLTDAQVSKIQGLQDQRMAERKQMAPQIQAERKAKMEMMQAKREQHNVQMKQILTADQYQKWQASKQQNRKQKSKMMNGKKMMRMQKAN